jgi:enamine deaminase RidA (YjgF/YER057c/UK114 family)
MLETGRGRHVRDVVDGAGLYFSRAASAGSFVFLGGTACDASGGIASDAQVPPPYAVSPAAHVHYQTRYIFERYSDCLERLGSDIHQVLQVEQWIPHKLYADGYLTVSRGPGFMDRGRPASALLCTGDLVPERAVINPMGIAVIPGEGIGKEILPSQADYHDRLTRPEFGAVFKEEGPFNEVLTAGPYVFIVGDVVWPAGYTDNGVRVPDFNWWGSAIRNEAEFLLNRLEDYLARAGCTIADVVHTTVYLNDIEDLFELDQVWRRRFGDNPPARSVVPVRGLGIPRREAPKLRHADGAVQMEHLNVAFRNETLRPRTVISTGAPTGLHQAEAIRAGELLWISSVMTGAASSTETQLDQLFDRLTLICETGGTTVKNLVRLRAFLTQPREAQLVYAALKRAVPSDPPTVAITLVPEPLPQPGCRVMLDGVAYVPDA